MRFSVRILYISLICIAFSAFFLGAATSLGAHVDPSTWVATAPGPLLVAIVVTGIVLYQHDNLRRLYEELTEAHRQLAEQSRRDPMTGVLNRAAFRSQAEENLRRAAGALLLIDVDHFKQVNDRFGHQLGDDALKIVAAAIRQAVRAQDIIGRIGGEEFAVYLPGAPHEVASSVAERIRASVEASAIRAGDGADVPVTVSIGVAPTDRTDALDERMRVADQHLYRAKHAGRNQVVMGVAA